MTADSNAVDVSKAQSGGVLKTVVKQGEGAAHPSIGDSVFVHYVGTLEDGTPFDSSRDRGEQFSFTLGKGQVIKAWDEGVASMKKGEICTLKCQPDYAYGESGSPPKIPPNAVLIFEVELFSWEGEDISPDKDRSIQRSIQRTGEKYKKPKEGGTVDVHVTGRQDSRVFVESDYKFVVGECTDQGLPEGLDKSVTQMEKGERSFITMKPKWAYGTAGSSDYNIPSNAEVEFEVELNDFENPKESWQMEPDEKLAESDRLKTKGTEFFQAGKLKLAIAKYSKIIDLLQYENNMEGELKEKRDQIYNAAHLNMALCFLKLDDTVKCVEHCNKVLDEDPNNVKALYRHGLALQKQTDYDAAMKDFQAVVELDAGNKAALQGIRDCKAKVKAQLDKEKKLFGGMFKKFAVQDYRAELQHKTEEKADAAKNPTESGDSDMNSDDRLDDEEMPVVDAAKPEEEPETIPSA